MGGSGTGTPFTTTPAAGSITKTMLVAFIEKALEESAKGASATDYDQALQAALDEISSSFPILRGVDETQALALNGNTIDMPSDLMEGGLISITLTDANDTVYDPLQAIQGGLKEYRYALNADSGTGRPEYYTEGESRTWYIWRPSDAAYNPRIEYYAVHPQDVNTILLPDQCALPLKVYATWWEAQLRGNPKYMATWQPQYLKQQQQLLGMYPGQPHGVYDP